MRQLYPVVPFEPSCNCLINLSNGRKSFLININAEGRISAAYSALLQQSGGLRRSLPSGRAPRGPDGLTRLMRSPLVGEGKRERLSAKANASHRCRPRDRGDPNAVSFPSREYGGYGS